MIGLFLLGLFAVIGTIAIITVAVIGGKWLAEYFASKLKNGKTHKVAFADTREVVDGYLKRKAGEADEISMENLERICEEAPFVSATVYEDGEIGEYEGYRASDYDPNFMARIKQSKGMVIMEA